MDTPSRGVQTTGQAQKALSDQESLIADARSNPEKYIKLESVEPTKEGFDSILSISGELTNFGPIPVKDAKINCDVFAESGTKLGSTRETAYKLILPGKSVSISELNMGFVDGRWQNVSCSVIGATIIDPNG